MISVISRPSMSKADSVFKLGLYGGMANNMYLLAKAMASEGIDVCFIRDRTDRYAISQPPWEDVRSTLPYTELPRTAGWTWEQWDGWELANGWTRPDWVVDPLVGGSGAGQPDLPRWARNRYQRVAGPLWPVILELMESCDGIVVCGVEGTALAALSGRPFLIMPHGGDIRIAARLARFGSSQSRWQRMFGNNYEQLIYSAYRRARSVVTHGVLRLGGPLDRQGRTFKSRMPLSRFERMGVPVFVRPRLGKIDRRRLLAELLSRADLPSIDADVVAFCPSRVDYYWKGQDRLIDGIKSLGGRVHLIVSGWGKDLDRFRLDCKGLCVDFLPFALSKQLLCDWYQAADLVVDQFVLGHYGTAAQEAMACGAPVMLWCDESDYLDQGWAPPPVFNVRTPEEITSALVRAVDDPAYVEQVGADGKDWILSQHGPAVIAGRLRSLFAERPSLWRT